MLRSTIQMAGRLLLPALLTALFSGCAQLEAAKPASLEVTDQAGRTARIKRLPERIISLAPSNTGILFALGLGEKVVGVTDYDDFPPGVEKKAKIGGFSTPDMEKIVALAPDLIVAAAIHEKKVVPELERRGLAVVVLAPKTLNGVVVAEGAPQAVLTPENIKATFGVNVLVYPDPLGGRLIVDPFPRRMRSEPYRIHLIGGGGRGAAAMRMLHAEGFQVTAGVLNEGDADLTMAKILGIEAVALPSFATINEESHKRNLELVATADCTIVADVPFGRANLLNLKAAASARRLIILEETPVEQRDFTSGKASLLYRGLKERATVAANQQLLSSIEETLARGETVAWHSA